ncbi:hypothetical protein FOZG_17730 [Fusarium oxysporum Fo47]|uniref:Uncharacterized protein n=2 Tax=Fusarium oxysporum Fo47 TaxID=660027 RepID=W9J901_FUSOX|nr:hypothetical protein FOZG_17730 [Fusarium oxysporum Fo47]
MTEAAVECCRPTRIVPSAEPITADTPPASEPIKRFESRVTGKPPLSSLAASPSVVNASILHLHRCTRTRGDTDTVLLFTTFSARLIGAILNHRRAIGRISASASRTCAQHCEAHPDMHRHAWRVAPHEPPRGYH